MSVIVDASVAAKWFADEAGSARAEAIYANEETLLAPDLILAEIGNVLWKKLRLKVLTREQVLGAIDILPAYFSELTPCRQLATNAVALAIQLNHPVYDCFYIALAAREQATLVTADEKLFAAARKAKVKARIL